MARELRAERAIARRASERFAHAQMHASPSVKWGSLVQHLLYQGMRKGEPFAPARDPVENTCVQHRIQRIKHLRFGPAARGDKPLQVELESQNARQVQQIL
jgi:hypothetical protein